MTNTAFFSPPIQSMAHCDVVHRPELVSGKGFEDSDMFEYDEPINVINMRSSTHISEMYLMQWTDISLLSFPPAFVTHTSHPASRITHVDLSKNQLSSLPLELFLLPNLISLNLSHNLLTSIPPPDRWGRTPLQILNLSHNFLSSDPSDAPPKKGPQDFTLFRELWFVDLSHNNLVSCPPWLLGFFFLSHLDLRGNKVRPRDTTCVGDNTITFPYPLPPLFLLLLSSSSSSSSRSHFSPQI